MQYSKFIISIIMAVVILISSLSCAEKSHTAPENDSENNKMEDETVTITYEQKNIRLNSNTKGVKILGERTLESASVINADWTCSGIEFYADCEGTLTLSVTAQNPCYFRAYIDDEPYLCNGSPYFTIEESSKITLENIERGTHLFRFVKATGYTLSKTTIRSVNLCGDILPTAPKDNELYLEFVGDSICCGWGVLPNEAGEYNGTYNCQDGTLAYPYMISQDLNADYSITALSGQGLLCGNPGMMLGYKYACYEKSSNKEYSFARKADAVIINIGTNDYSQKDKLGITDQQFLQAYESFLRLVREKNEEDCKIILVYNVMNDTFSSAIRKAVKNLGGEDAGYYLYCAERTSRERGNSHPSINENKKYTENIGAYIKEILDIK